MDRMDLVYAAADFIKYFDLELKQNDKYTTVAGLFIHKFDSLPSIGDKINLENYIQQSKNMTKQNDTLAGEIRLDFYRDANQYLFAYKLKACNAFLIFVLRCLIINVVCH